MLPATVEFNPDWLMVRDVLAPTIAELNAALATMGPGVIPLLEDTAASDTVAVWKTAIAPLALVHPLLGSTFSTPINAWNLVAARAMSLGLEPRVMPLLHWLRAQTSVNAKSVDALWSVNLAVVTLQARKELRDKIAPPPPPDQMHIPVQFVPRPPEAAAPPPAVKQPIGAADRWGDMLNSLLRLYNITVSADLPPIWDVIATLSRDRAIPPWNWRAARQPNTSASRRPASITPLRSSY